MFCDHGVGCMIHFVHGSHARTCHILHVHLSLYMYAVILSSRRCFLPLHMHDAHHDMIMMHYECFVIMGLVA